jgi:hypothetical protein
MYHDVSRYRGVSSWDRVWGRSLIHLGPVWDRYIKTYPKAQDPLKRTGPNIFDTFVPAFGTVPQPPLGVADDLTTNGSVR